MHSVSLVFFLLTHPLSPLGPPPVCRSTKEQEQKRVEKEMAHIRSKFTSESHMNGYQRKKYVWKILYMYMLGYEVDFGHMEAVNLVSSPKYSEKCAARHASTASPLRAARRRVHGSARRPPHLPRLARRDQGSG